jgi:hypothetical protein
MTIHIGAQPKARLPDPQTHMREALVDGFVLFVAPFKERISGYS